MKTVVVNAASIKKRPETLTDTHFEHETSLKHFVSFPECSTTTRAENYLLT